MSNPSLQSIASQLMASPKGLLAADESNKSAKKRFDALNIPCTEETRREYRQMLITSPKFAQYISGVIFYDETIRQTTDDGTAFTKLLENNLVIPGIKVDGGLVDLPNFAGETITEGLDGLSARLDEYYKMGARFTKWRSAFSIDEAARLPTPTAIHANLNVMARYAAIVQSAGMVPIVEPEVLFDGNHSIKASGDTLSLVLRVLFELLLAYRVDLTGLILKTSMVLAGKDATNQSTPQEVGQATLDILNKRVPKDVAGIVFLSGGQSPEQATANLAAVASAGQQPWPITFSFSRAVQDGAIAKWAGKAENVASAQDQLMSRIVANSSARQGNIAA